MNKYIVPTKKADDPANKSLFQSIDETIRAIQQRAYEFFQARNGAPANEVEDWLRAERELFETPAGELTETDAAFVVTITDPDFEAKQLEVAVDANSVTICGEARHRKEAKGEQDYTELTDKEIFRRFSLPTKIATDKVTANLSHGELKVNLPKAAATVRTENAEQSNLATAKAAA